MWIIDPTGKHLGTIALGGGMRATNLAWGGGDWQTLFITTFHELACVRMEIPGVPVPRPDLKGGVRDAVGDGWSSATPL